MNFSEQFHSASENSFGDENHDPNTDDPVIKSNDDPVARAKAKLAQVSAFRIFFFKITNDSFSSRTLLKMKKAEQNLHEILKHKRRQMLRFYFMCFISVEFEITLRSYYEQISNFVVFASQDWMKCLFHELCVLYTVQYIMDGKPTNRIFFVE